MASPSPLSGLAPLSGPARLQRVDATVLALAALVIRIPAFIADRHFHPDDGTYGMSAVLMRGGAAPFRTVFSSQGPLHLVLVYAGDLITGRQMNSPRAVAVMSGIVATLAAAAIGARVGTRRGAWIAGGLVATTGSMLWTSGPLTADAVTIAVVAIATVAALRYDDAPSTRRVVLVGVLCGAGLMAKVAVAALGFAPALLLVLRHRRSRDVVATVSGAAVVMAALVLPFGAGRVWDQAIRYQLDTEREQSILRNARKVVSTIWSRDLLLATLVVVALGWAATRWRDSTPLGRGIVLWAAAMTGFLVVQPALWRNHISHLVLPLAIVVARVLGPSRPSRVSRDRSRRSRVLIVALVIVTLVQVRFSANILVPAGYDADSRAALRALEAVPSDARVISDEIGLVWRGGRRTPDDLVDMSIKQFQQERVTLERLESIAARSEVCGVLIWSRRHLGSVEGLATSLATLGYQLEQRFGGQQGARSLWVKRRCPDASG